MKLAGEEEKAIAIRKKSITKGYQPSQSSLLVAGASKHTNTAIILNQEWALSLVKKQERSCLRRLGTSTVHYAVMGLTTTLVIITVF